ncbi:MAG TPA: PPOX class F420-dependent oxidoreductase [Marmoricola sp.]|nr:PPOX class F420-dependent oxidoreductase [Marmoricola sp.]
MPKPIADERYVLLTTFRKNGDAKPTPVWVAPLGEELAVITLADAWKVRRVRNTPEVTLQPCDVRGKVSPDAPIYKGRGRVVTDPAEVGQVKTAMNRKYALARVGNTLETLLGGLMGRKPRVGILITLDPDQLAPGWPTP